ncbi:DUF427 domain-containing protein [Lacisediminimonas sp.]|uniref:DUF427 domain-containing protein n=1 Tax=Lacisediminimonas sp. TaxID=3060582 RepID=UPI00271BB7BB|nr:DUF427 domain-containing protein [Lacisediminimonas sp.]MDO8299931.1 DUF427 domain-containing protein [Lacisediminimonas sp.]
MPKAIWKDTVIAQAPADQVVLVEGNMYFPADAVDAAFLRSSDKQTVCGWKGTASYYDLVVDGELNKDAAWYYPAPKDAAIEIAGRIAFWRGVQVVD